MLGVYKLRTNNQTEKKMMHLYGIFDFTFQFILHIDIM